MLSTLTLVVARSILLVVMIFSAVLTVLWTSVYIKLSKLFSVFPMLNFSTEIATLTRFLRRSIFSEQILSILVE